MINLPDISSKVLPIDHWTSSLSSMGTNFSARFDLIINCFVQEFKEVILGNYTIIYVVPVEGKLARFYPQYYIYSSIGSLNE